MTHRKLLRILSIDWQTMFHRVRKGKVIYLFLNVFFFSLTFRNSVFNYLVDLRVKGESQLNLKLSF